VHDERWQELESDECRSLLAGTHLGRVAFVVGDFPVVLPVNYALDDGRVVFRTRPGILRDAAVAGAAVAFEIDGIDQRSRTGWSVLVRGHAEHVTDDAERHRLEGLGLVPWAPGARPDYVRLTAVEITGRRINVASLPSNFWG
jgi:uncharacterized protein